MGIEISSDTKHHETYWRVQRFGWICMLLVIVASLAGLFGRGPLARARTSSGRVHVDYVRFGRMTASEPLEIKVEPPHESDHVAISIPRAYIRRFVVSGVVPEPESVTGSGDELVYVFRANRTSALHVSMQMEAQPGTFGQIAGEVHCSGSALRFSQFFWP